MEKSEDAILLRVGMATMEVALNTTYTIALRIKQYEYTATLKPNHPGHFFIAETLARSDNGYQSINLLTARLYVTGLLLSDNTIIIYTITK